MVIVTTLVAFFTSFFIRGLIFSPICLGNAWAKAVFPYGVPQGLKMDVKLVLLVIASALWQALTAVALVFFLGLSWKLLVVTVLFSGNVKFIGLENMGFAQRPKEAVFIELVSTLAGFLGALAVCMMMIR